jgi:hypothetical protein
MTHYQDSPVATLVAPPWWLSLACIAVAGATFVLVVRALHQRDWRLTLAEHREMQVVLGMVSAILLVMLVARKLGLGAVQAGAAGITLGAGAVLGIQAGPVASRIGGVCGDAARVRVAGWISVFATAYATALVVPRASVGVPAGTIVVVATVLALKLESR